VKLVPHLEHYAKSREFLPPRTVDFSCAQVNSLDRTRSNTATQYKLKPWGNTEEAQIPTRMQHFEKSKLGMRLLLARTSPHSLILRAEEPCAGQNTARAMSSLRSPPVTLRVIRVRTRRMSIESRLTRAPSSLRKSRNSGIGVPSANDN
jgi:hypothetical protein